MCGVDVLQKVIALCKSHGFIVESCMETISNGLHHFLSYGPLGADMRRNLRDEWWRETVLSKGNIYGFEAQYLTQLEEIEKDDSKICLVDTQELMNELQELILRQHADKSAQQTAESGLHSVLNRLTMFPRRWSSDQYLEWFFKMMKTVPGAKLPFGIAKISKNNRKLPGMDPMFRSLEEEVMSVQFLCDERKSGQWVNHWRRQRLIWWRKFANNPTNFSLVDKHGGGNMIQYNFPWGEDQIGNVESIMHSQHAPSFTNPNPQPSLDSSPLQLIQAEANLNRGFFVYLLDAYEEKERANSQGNVALRKVLRLHPKLAPLKVAVLPQTREMSEVSQQLATELRGAGINALHMNEGTQDECYALQDEIGTPYCITILDSTLTNGVVTLRSRNTTLQEFIHISEVVNTIKHHLGM